MLNNTLFTCKRLFAISSLLLYDYYMAAIYNESGHYKTIRQTCYTANIAYIVLRVIYMVLFLVAKLYVLAAIAGGSVLVYLACLLLIKNRKYYPYALICGNEYFAFVIVTTILLGFNTCFHFYLIGLSVVSFFTSYFTKTHNIKAAVFWAFLSVCIYLTIYFISANRTPTYAIDKWLELTLVTIHIILVFLFVVFYLVVFLKYALSLEKRVINESRTDELTQINNRYALYDYFGQLKDKESKILALFDIDDFKIVNDKHGHVTGDYVLKKVAEVVQIGVV